jgi:CubicO group peptidase (beta-lactamase class C family)
MRQQTKQQIMSVYTQYTSILIILAGIFTVSLASSAERSELFHSRTGLFEAWMENLTRTLDLPGISVGLVHEQELLYAKSFGHADINQKFLATNQTIYSVASLSKLFTALGLMQLVEGKQIELDDAAVQYIPELYQLQSSKEDIESITIRSILRHTTGLPINNNYLLTSASPVINNLTQILEGLSQQKLIHPPNSRFHYSNLAMSLGGIIISRVAQKDYSQYIADTIFTPLHMNASSFDILPRNEAAIGYSRNTANGRTTTSGWDMGKAIGIPAAGLKTNIQDLARFVSWHFETLNGTPSRILDQGTLEYMQHIHWAQLSFVLPKLIQSGVTHLSDAFDIGGSGLGYSRTGKFVRHSGGIDGFGAELLMDNENKIGIIVLANSSDAPVNWDASPSISRNLFEIVGTALLMELGPMSGDYADYQKVYTDHHYFNYYAMPSGEGLSLMDLNSDFPMRSPIMLSPLQEDDAYFAPDHKAFYAEEFFVRFRRNDQKKITSLVLASNILNAMD